MGKAQSGSYGHTLLANLFEYNVLKKLKGPIELPSYQPKVTPQDHQRMVGFSVNKENIHHKIF